MSDNFKVLPQNLLAPGTFVYQGDEDRSTPVELHDPARSVMTDFHLSRPFSIGSASTLAEVNARMIACGVRLLFIADNAGMLQGLVTYNDLYGEKPVRYLQENGGNRDQIVVRDIMTPLSQIDSLQASDLNTSTVGDIAETMNTIGRQHMLVSESTDDGQQVVIGLFSSTHIERRAGVVIELSARANTFAELGRALT